MRIVSGKYRHRVLETSPGQTTRPITDRVKTSLFDRLEPRLAGARVADVFAGTGTMGFEALSRGASSVLFVESDRKAFELLERNVAALRAEADVFCWQTDASKCSFRPRGCERFFPYDVVFFDPPYLFTSRMKAGTMLYRALARLARPDVTAPDALLVLRCASDTAFDVPDDWLLDERLDYSSMAVHLFRKRPIGFSADAGDAPAD